MEWVIDILQILIDKKIRPTKIVFHSTGAINIQTKFLTKDYNAWIVEMKTYKDSLNLEDIKKTLLTQTKTALDNGSTITQAISQEDIYMLECLKDDMKEAKVELKTSRNFITKTAWRLEIRPGFLDLYNEDTRQEATLYWDTNLEWPDNCEEIVEMIKDFE